MPYKMLECQQCGDEFEGWHNSKYCCSDCGRKSRGVWVECKHCGDDYTVPPSDKNRSTYCSEKCMGLDREDKVEKECDTCQQKYSVKKSRADSKFCSKECKEDAGRAVMSCKFCGDEFQFPKSKVGTRKFCSRECYSKQNDGTVTKTCEQCGDLFEAYRSRAGDIKHCSWQCRAKQPTLTCDECGKDFDVPESRKEAGRQYCSRECSSKAKSGPRHPRWDENSAPYYGRNWNRIRCVVRNRDCHRCRNCGIEESELEKELHVHHIKPIREFDSPQRANNPNNLISFCPTCHRELERDPKACKALL